MSDLVRAYPVVFAPGVNNVEQAFGKDDNEQKRIYAILTSLRGLYASGTPPTSPNVGDLWQDTAVSKIKKWDGSAWNVFLEPTGQLSQVLNEALGANIAAASTIDLTNATGNFLHITGTTAITAVTLGAGMRREVIFDGILTLTHHATNNNLPGAANITTAAGDRASYYSDGTTVYCTKYVKADGTPIVTHRQIMPGGVRQTVLQGAVDSNGYANFLTTGTGTTPGVSATSTNVIITAAAGFDSYGQVDRIGVISADSTISGAVTSKTISSITRSGTTATLTTSTAHGLITGAVVVISGATSSVYNGTYTITVTGSTTFTYVMASDPGGSASVVGSYVVTNFIYADITNTTAYQISSITRSGTTATLTTSTAHGLVTGSSITVSGASPSQYNGTYTITVTSATTLTYTMASDPGSSATANGSYIVNNTAILGSGLLPPFYELGGTPSTTSGQYTFNVSQMKGYLGNGSTAPQCYRVFLGECNVGASSVLSATTYVLFGTSTVKQATIVAATAYLLNHNIGTDMIDISHYIECKIAEFGYSVGDRIYDFWSYTTVAQGLQVSYDKKILYVNSSGGQILAISKTGGGAVNNLTYANWSFGANIQRGW